MLPWLAPGERVCAMKDCIRVLPSEKKYRWKTCEACRDRARVGKDRAAGAVEREADATIASDSELDVVSLVGLLQLLRIVAYSFVKQKVPLISRKQKDSGSGSEADGIETVVCYYFYSGLAND